MEEQGETGHAAEPESASPPDGAPPIRLFVCYRREDSAGYAGRLFDALVEGFGAGAVFMDIDTIAPGSDFVQVIEEALAGCDVVLVLIGPAWLTAQDRRHRRRLDNEDDFVRLEIQRALQVGIRVLPVLVGGADMPASGDLPAAVAGLARRHAFELSDRRWHADVGQLIAALRTPANPLRFARAEAPLPPSMAEALPIPAYQFAATPPALVPAPPPPPPIEAASPAQPDAPALRRSASATLTAPKVRSRWRSAIPVWARLAALLGVVATALLIKAAIDGGNWGAYSGGTIALLAGAALAATMSSLMALLPRRGVRVAAAAAAGVAGSVGLAAGLPGYLDDIGDSSCDCGWGALLLAATVVALVACAITAASLIVETKRARHRRARGLEVRAE